jgi:trk system potassium uptake protein TrkA
VDCNFLKEITLEIDTVIVATKREKTNVLSSLFLKEIGLKRILTLSKSHDYNSLLLLSSGCSIINPNAITIETIIQKSRKGKITSVRSLKNQNIDIVEAQVTESCTHLGNSIKS